jgi:hypothetical protein
MQARLEASDLIQARLHDLVRGRFAAGVHVFTRNKPSNEGGGGKGRNMGAKI